MTSHASHAKGGNGSWHRSRAASVIYPWLGVLAVLVTFELLSRTGILSSRDFPPVTEIFGSLWGQLQTGRFWYAIGNTLQGWAIGLGIAAAIAIPSGVLLGSSQILYRSLRVIIEFLRPIPSVALVPLAILVFGTGLETKVFLVAFACFWPLLIQSIYGVQDVDPVALDTARVYGLGRVARLARIAFPSTVPYMATGLRISSAVALILAVTAELVAGSPGLGSEIAAAQSGGAITLMYALIVTTGLLGWALNGVLRRLERRVLHWHPSQRADEGSA